MARARSLRRLRLSRSVWDCQRLLSVLLLSTRSFQRCAGRRVGPRNGLVLLLIKKIFLASGGAAQAAGPILRFLSSARPDLRITRRLRRRGASLRLCACELGRGTENAARAAARRSRRPTDWGPSALLLPARGHRRRRLLRSHRAARGHHRHVGSSGRGQGQHDACKDDGELESLERDLSKAIPIICAKDFGLHWYCNQPTKSSLSDGESGRSHAEAGNTRRRSLHAGTHRNRSDCGFANH